MFEFLRMSILVDAFLYFFLIKKAFKFLNKPLTKKTLFFIFFVKSCVDFIFYIVESDAFIYLNIMYLFYIFPLRILMFFYNIFRNYKKRVSVTETKEETAKQIKSVEPVPGVEYVSFNNFSNDFKLSDEELIKKKIKSYLTEKKYNERDNLIPSSLNRRNIVLISIFSFLVFVYTCLIFFHFPFTTYVMGLIILFIFYKVIRKFDIVNYIYKQVKNRPNEKVQNIVANQINDLIINKSGLYSLIFPICAVILSFIIFLKPVILYEKIDGGYAVRFYAFGITNFKEAEIPAKHKNENVISLRGNTFSNMPDLKKVVLPDSIIEIRGQAFKNDVKLESVNMPKNLQYLGGGAFYNCKSLKEIIFSDSITYIGGESFKDADNLKKVVLSENITEIKGSTFENCVSLESIKIPDNVTRIGGHAFYNCNSLNNVEISENSKLVEIGSSAFRLCPNLYTITIPKNTEYNIRAFKESPTSISRYGVIDYKDLYNHNTFLYFQHGESYVINKYFSYATEYNSTLTLDAVSSEIETEFNLTYENINGEKISFKLTKNNPEYIINNNLVITVSDEHYFENVSGSLGLDVYYN